jgi:replicative DNA helicase
MNNYLEENVVGAFIMSDYAKTKLPSINPNWFNEFNKRVVTVMQQLYLDSKPIALHTLFPFFKDKAFELSEFTRKYYSDATIEYDLLQMEVMYKRKKIVEDIQNLDLDCDLHELQNKLEIINQESRVSLKNQVVPMSKIVGKVLDELQVRIERGNNLEGLSTGWRYLDKYIGGWNKGNLVVIGARPGMGKTALGLNFCIEGCPFAKYVFVSVEMSDEELAKRQISYFSKVENYKIRNATMSLKEVENISKQLYNQEYDYDVIDSKDNNVFNIISMLKLQKAKKGLDVVVIDYLQKMDAGERDTRKNVSVISTALKNFARESGITVIALAQLNRDGKDDRPQLTDLKESGQIEQDADVVLFPFRPSYYLDVKPDVEEDAELIIAKNRHGQCTDIPVTFEGKYTKYTERI